MAGRLFAGLLASFVCLVSGLCESRPDYSQISCEIDRTDDYAVIWFVKDSDRALPHPHRYSINFQPAGVVVRFPPEYFAPQWSNADLIVSFPSTRSQSGVLRLRLHGTIPQSQLFTVGSVQRKCWNDIKKFIQVGIAAKGIAVHVTEIVEHTP